MSVDPFLTELRQWVKSQDEIVGVLLVGSHARGQAREDSDVDVVLLARAPTRYLEVHSWMEQFGAVARVEEEDWGNVTSLRVWYSGGLEVEFGWTEPDWAALPPDPGTEQVVKDGAAILFDPKGVLAALLAAVPLT